VYQESCVLLFTSAIRLVISCYRKNRLVVTADF
jgi:hypothetical protein